MLFTDATHSSGGVVPPFLIEQESLLDQIVRPFLPVFIDETLVLRQRLDTARRFLTERDATAYVIPKTETLPCGFVYKLPSLARREGEIRSPIRIGLGDCGRGKRRREPRNTRMQRAVNEFGKSRHSERISGVYLDRRTFSCQYDSSRKILCGRGRNIRSCARFSRRLWASLTPYGSFQLFELRSRDQLLAQVYEYIAIPGCKLI